MPAKKAAAKTALPKPVVLDSKELRLTIPRKALLPDIIRELERGFKIAGCEGCRSGLDKIVLGGDVIQKTL